MVGLLRKVFGDANEKALKRFYPLVAEVNAHDAALRDISVDELRARTDDFRRRLADDVPLDELLPEAMAVAREAIISGVNVNAIAPGYIDTPMTDAIDDAVRRMISMATPAGRFGSPQDVANLAVYLASEEANFVVGQVISPNGGYVIA